MERGLVHGQTVPKEYEELVEPHVESMNYFYEEGLTTVADNIKAVEVGCVYECSM